MNKTSLTAVVLALILAALIGGLVMVFGTKNAHLSIPEAPEGPPPGYVEYKNEHYGFAFYYPESLTITEFDEGQDTRTITIENLDEGLGFQIFALPYSGVGISEERFRKDIPTGVRRKEAVVMVGGIEAVAFLAENSLLGEAREVWYIRDGYLIEITAPSALDEWLSTVLSTWKII